MNTNPRIRHTIIGAVAASLALAACGGDSSNDAGPGDDSASSASEAPQSTEVAVSEVIRSVFYAPLYIAAEGGLFDEAGLDVSITTANGSDKVAAALISGQADIGLLGPEAIVYIHQQESDADLRILSQLTQRDGSFLVAREPDQDFELGEIADAKVLGWRPGSMPQLVMNYLIDKDDLETDYVSNIQGSALAGAFTSGEGDYVQLFEPVASMMERDGTGSVVASVGELAEPFPYTTFAMELDGFEANPEAAAAFVSAVDSAVGMIGDSDAMELATLISPYFPDTDADLLAQSIERYATSGVWADEPTLDDQAFERLLDVMIAGGVLESDQRVAPADVTIDWEAP
ncbi:MAG: ABC transporter substrate-binding protein [Ilumatobacter fluminis]|uniref:ABC transporter substrate-binding protein n=1 Tax=Ilumatobacter fluminis TaxID=467091 RepID=UPI0032F09C07